MGKLFRILGLDERKGRWVVEQDFQGNIRVNVTCFFSFFSGHLQIFPSLLTIKACKLDDRETSTTITIKPTIPVRRGYTGGFLNISFWLPDGISLKHEHCAVGVEQTKEVSVDVMAQCADFGETTTKLIVPEIHDFHSIFWTPGGSKKFQLPKILVRLF